MFPLSTPTTSGLWVDWLTLAIVLVPVCAFVLGVADLWRAHAQRAAGNLDVVTLAVYAALSLVGLAVAVTVAGARGIPVAQAAFLAVAARGLLCAGRGAPRLWQWWKSASGDDLVRAAAFAGAASLSLWFWTDVFRDHVALPGIFDGIVHAAYYLKIVETGVPTLGRVPIGFGSIFGTQLFDFYPTGTHSLIAIASGFWGQWGVISHAGILKAWFTLAVAAAPWALVWFVRRLMPQAPWWLGPGLVLVAMPGFRFPIEAAHEGGASRLLAHVLMMPVYADVLTGRVSSWRSRVVAGIFLGLAFLMHPSAFVTIAVLLTYAAILDARSDTRWRGGLATIGGACGAVAIGGLVAIALLKWNGGAAAVRDAVKSFSWTALGNRLQGGWAALFDPEYGMGPVKEAVVVAGFLVLLLRRKALRAPWRVVLFPVLMLLVGALALSAQLISLPGFRLLGGAFYDETPRVVELMYESVGLCLVALAWAVWQSVSGGTRDPASLANAPTSLPHRISDDGPPGSHLTTVIARGGVLRNTSRRAKVGSSTAVALVAAALAYQQAWGPWVHDHVGFFDRRFVTARISRLQELGRWIEENTEPDAILFYPPFDTEIWQAWTGRRGVFMYGECHVHNHLVPCSSRKDLVNRRIDVLREALAEPVPATRCLAQIDRFGRPGYFVVSSPFVSSHSFPLCSDASYVTTLDGHAVIAYRKP
jgi:hypothetical protein